MDLTFDDLIPGRPAYQPPGGEVSFDDLIPGRPAYEPPGGELSFDDLIPGRRMRSRAAIGSPQPGWNSGRGDRPQPMGLVWNGAIDRQRPG